MIIIRDPQGNIISQEASEPYRSVRAMRRDAEQVLCDKATGTRSRATERLEARLASRGLEMPPDGFALSLNTGETYAVRSCNCEDYPCCGH